ncbi:MAG: SGNH/GDSL hydrolase family protein [bacterium]
MYLFLGSLVFLLLMELLLRRLYDRISATKHHGPTHYSWSFVTPTGKAISPLEGDLKLSLNPFTVYSNAPYQKSSKFSTNERGIRADSEISVKNLPSGQKRILILGGSTAFGTGLNSNDDTFAAHLSGMIEDAIVLNGGIIGFVSGQEVAQLASDLIDYNPSLIITLDGFNDLFIQLGKSKSWPGPGANEFDGLVYKLVELYRVRKSMFHGFLNLFRGIHSFLKTIYRTFKCLAGMIIGRRLRISLKFHFSSLSKAKDNKESNGMTLDEISEQYALNLSKITRMGNGFGYRHLAILQPALVSEREHYEPNGRFHFSGEQIEKYELFLERTIKRLEELNVEYYCAHNDFKTRHTLFLDDIHLTSEGCKELATAAMTILKQKGMICVNMKEDFLCKAGEIANE